MLSVKLTKSGQDFNPLFPYKVLCGTKPFPDTMKAKKYKLQEQFFTKKDFLHIMKNLPEEVRIMLLSDMRQIITSFKMTMVLLTKYPLLGPKLEKNWKCTHF